MSSDRDLMLDAILRGATAALLLLTAQHVHGAAAWLVCAPLARFASTPPSWRASLALGWSFTATMGLLGEGPWVVETTRRYFELAPAPAALLGGGLVLACAAAFGALLGLALRLALVSSSLVPGWRVGAAWVVFEESLVRAIPYYPWASLAETQVEFPLVAQIVSLLGERGLSFAIALVGSGLGWTFLHGSMTLGWGGGGDDKARVGEETATSESWRSVRGTLACICAVVVLVLGFGVLRLGLVEVESSSCRVSLVDADIEADLPAPEVLSRYEAVTRIDGLAPFVVWPESALPGDPSTDALLRRGIGERSSATQAWLLAGGPRRGWDATWVPRLFNSAFLFEPDANLRVYDKRHLVPFVEYWPQIGFAAPDWLGLQQASPGSEPAVFQAGVCRVGVLICFEVESARLAAELVGQGAEGIVVLANDARLSNPAVRRELRQARLRALETGVPVARAANGGISLIVDPLGKVVARGRGRILTRDLPRPVQACGANATSGVAILAGLSIVVPVVRGLRRRWGRR